MGSTHRPFFKTETLGPLEPRNVGGSGQRQAGGLTWGSWLGFWAFLDVLYLTGADFRAGPTAAITPLGQ